MKRNEKVTFAVSEAGVCVFGLVVAAKSRDYDASPFWRVGDSALAQL